MLRHWPVLTILLLLGGGLAARAEDYVVVESSAADIKTGTTIGAGATLTIPDKARVVLMSGSGKTVALTGPFKGAPPADAGAGNSAALKAVVAMLGSDDQRQVPGAVRAADVAWRADITKSLTDVVAIDATDGGDVCLYDAATAQVTHNPAKAGAMIIHSTDGDAAATVTWPAQTAVLPWPKALKLTDGSTFLIEQPDQSDAAMATIHLLPADKAKTDIERVAQMAEAGCKDQAHLLLAVIAKTAK